MLLLLNKRLKKNEILNFPLIFCKAEIPTSRDKKSEGSAVSFLREGLELFVSESVMF